MKDKSVSSSVIGKTAKAVDLALTVPLTGFRANVKPQTDLPSDTFGMVGDLILGSTYRDIQDITEGLIGDAVAVTQSWTRLLGYAKRNWETAEELSMRDAMAVRSFL
ncbi:hypothetical protein ACFXJ8_20470 [Nonomuraea sp. NPDC059194]|uniref:hypothetical protein n=1 Tax=Nonomuraea sp. NPDC059194 TaxID=3346764 RepID=UPI0036C7F70D